MKVNRYNYNVVIDHTFKVYRLEKVKIGIDVGRANLRKSDKISGSPTPHIPVLPPLVLKPLLMKTVTCSHLHHFFLLFSFFNLSCEGSWNILFSPELWLLGSNETDDLRHDNWLIMNTATVIKECRSGIELVQEAQEPPPKKR